jgi:hypothetical protein
MSSEDIFGETLHIINIGLESFAEDLRSDDVEVIQLDWHPPTGGNARLASLLSKLDDGA